MRTRITRFWVGMVFFAGMVAGLHGQGCTLGNYTTVANLGPGNFPYTSPSSGITATVSAPGVPTLGNVSYTCNGQTFACTATAWWPQTTAHIITVNFSAPVLKMSVVINGTNQGEVLTFTANAGAVTLSDYCTTNFSLVAANQLIDNVTTATGTLISANSSTGATSFTISHNGVGAGSRLSILDCFVPAGPFAVTLDRFDANYRPDLDDVRLDWHSLDEQDFRGFEVEHSLDGEQWEVLGLVPASGSGGSYGYSHLEPVQGTHYYRLRQEDLNGHWTLSETREVQVERPGGAALIFPNPNKGQFELRAIGRKGELSLVDALGRVVLQQNYDQVAQVSLRDAAPGVYWLRIVDETMRIEVQRVVVE